MSFEAYHKGMEEREKKDQEIYGLKEQVNEMGTDNQRSRASDKKNYERIRGI